MTGPKVAPDSTIMAEVEIDPSGQSFGRVLRTW